MLTSNKILLKTETPVQISKRTSGSYNMTEGGAIFAVMITEATPIEDYKKLIKTHVQTDELVLDDVLNENFKRIATAARNTIWKLLFGTKPASPENLRKAADFLDEYKSDACFYSPYIYNDWIVSVRDELLKQGMLAFWRTQMVQRELGPCCSRDSDIFADAEDELPTDFYEHAGCVAVFKKQAENITKPAENAQHTAFVNAPKLPPTSPSASNFADFAPQLSLKTPLAEYKKLLEDYLQMDEYCDDAVLEENFKKIAATARKTIWQLLFKEQPPLKPENLTKASELLAEYKSDACFYDPCMYNDWIVSVRDELLKRKMYDFWRDHVVAKELGPCWARDSDLFDDLEDKMPEEFYKHAGCVAPFSKTIVEN